MLLVLYACTNNYYKTTRYQGPIAQKFEGEECASARINIKPTFPVGKGIPRAQSK
jgi:hypothetical protein